MCTLHININIHNRKINLQVVQGPNIPNAQTSPNPLDLHIMYEQQFQQQQTMFSKQQEKLKQQLQ